jgi:hypothetical protein
MTTNEEPDLRFSLIGYPQTPNLGSNIMKNATLDQERFHED